MCHGPELPNGHRVCQGGHETGQVGETPTVPKWSYYKKQAQGRKPVPQHGKGTHGVGERLMSEGRRAGVNRKWGNLIKTGSCSDTC